MPIYNYECLKCKSKFEEVKSMNDRDKVKCPDCGYKANLRPSPYSFKMNIKG